MLDFYDIDKDYIEFLQKSEIEKRGFTCVPNMEYGEKQQKFLCGIVLEINNIHYYVPVSLNKKRLPDTVLILIPTDKYNQIKGTLKFNYMIPVPGYLVKLRRIKLEIDPKRKRFLQDQLSYCQSIEKNILNQAKRTYNKWISGKGSESFYQHSCDFLFLEDLCKQYEAETQRAALTELKDTIMERGHLSIALAQAQNEIAEIQRNCDAKLQQTELSKKEALDVSVDPFYSQNNLTAIDESFEQIKHIEHWINNYPRKILAGFSANMMEQKYAII